MRMVDEDIQPGQRWVSDAEPELGLGVVMSAGNGRVSILFRLRMIAGNMPLIPHQYAGLLLKWGII